MKNNPHLAILIVVVLISSCQLKKKSTGNAFAVSIIYVQNERDFKPYFEFGRYSFKIENFDSSKMFVEVKYAEFELIGDTINIFSNHCGMAEMFVYSKDSIHKKLIARKNIDFHYFPITIFSSVGDNGDKVNKEEFNDFELYAAVQNWNIEFVFNVKSFSLVTYFDGSIISTTSNGNTFSNEQLELIKKLPSNSIIVLTDVKLENDCPWRNNPNVFYIVN